MTVRCLVLQLEVTRKLLRIWWIAFAMRETHWAFTMRWGRVGPRKGVCSARVLSALHYEVLLRSRWDVVGLKLLQMETLFLAFFASGSDLRFRK